METDNIEFVHVKVESLEQNKSENLDKKCRGCLIEEENMNDLFEKRQGDKKDFPTLAEILLKITGIEVKHEDGAPSQLCQQCTNIITNFYSFKTTFIETEEYLNKIKSDVEPADVECHVEVIEDQSDLDIGNLNKREIKQVKETTQVKNKIGINNNKKKRIKTTPKEEIKSFVCEVCGLSCKKKENLVSHLETHSEERKYICQYCNKAVKLKSSFIKHLKLHTHPRQIVCDICGQRFNLRAHLDIHHKAKHLRIRDFQCNLCDKAFSMKTTLEHHIERHNPNRERKFRCKFCHMTYMEKRHLVRHHKEKHKEVQYDCHFCGISYIEESDLAKHLKNCHPSPEQQEKQNNDVNV